MRLTLTWFACLITTAAADIPKPFSAKFTVTWGSPTDLPEAKQPHTAVVTDDPRVFRTTVRKQRDEGVHTYRIPGLATTPKGTLIAVFDIRHTSGGDLPGHIDVGMMRSTDNGETWGQMKAILDFDDKVPNSRGIASTDGGISWKISPAAIPGNPPTSESQIVELSDGSLLLSMRNESRAGKRAWAKWTWKDTLLNGEWSPHWLDVTDPTCMASIVRHPSGKLIFSNPNHPSKRVALTIRTSDDDGKTWSSGKLLDPASSMYSCLTVLKDGRMGLLYESGDTAGLVFARFPLDWVTADK